MKWKMLLLAIYLFKGPVSGIGGHLGCQHLKVYQHAGQFHLGPHRLRPVLNWRPFQDQFLHCFLYCLVQPQETCASEGVQVDCEGFFSCSQWMAVADNVFFREGEIAALRCPLKSSSLVWRKNSSLGLQELIEEVGRPQVTQKNMLFIMKVLKNDSGMYTCMEKNGDKNAWINLTVYSECYVNDTIYDMISYEKKSFTKKKNLRGPPPLCELNTIWYKVSDSCHEKYFSSKNDIYFEMVSKSDEGIYKSKHVCKYKGQSYYTSETHYLIVKDSLDPLQPKIIKPQPNENITVDLGQKVEIMCLAVLDYHSEIELMELHWINGSSDISLDQNMTVYYNRTIQEQRHDKSYHMIARLVVKNVSKEHLDTAFTCKLESTLQELINVSVTLKQKVTSKSVPAVSLVIVAVSAFVVVVVTIVYYKLKIDIVLFFRDLQRNPCPPTDGKRFDAYISYYQTCSEEALTEDERILLLDVLETQYGYRLCVYDRDMLPGEAAVEAVLEHVKQSRRLLLIPRAEGPQAEDQYGLLGGLHAALVDRHTRLILIQKTPRGGLDSLPESLRLLARSGGAVTWKGKRSAPLSSGFWKHMLYHMPARRRRQNELELM